VRHTSKTETLDKKGSGVPHLRGNRYIGAWADRSPQPKPVKHSAIQNPKSGSPESLVISVAYRHNRIDTPGILLEVKE
jgi:hypothetical protein